MNHSKLIRKKPGGCLPDTPQVYDKRLEHHQAHTEALESEVRECEFCGDEAPVQICGDCGRYFCGRRCGDFVQRTCDECVKKQGVRSC